ncbi:hypothetical protein EYF80_039419 [Liparis tanakae]|uniref:Uncharacterized protein n=1 Tax=Liparis tanakae TaxID=230148 RepID=A0A4Z2GCF6_9TELE|nr:hypothetical protein EYF80_039419 [Liparis tanakae]
MHAARGSHSARQRYQTPSRRHSNKPTSANHNPSPPISPGNCRSAGDAVHAHAILFCIAQCAFAFIASCFVTITPRDDEVAKLAKEREESKPALVPGVGTQMLILWYTASKEANEHL